MIHFFWPTVEPINHMGMQPHKWDVFIFTLLEKTAGKIGSCTQSLGSLQRVVASYRQTQDLITCHIRPQTPQRHWLALHCNETGYPVKWPPHIPSGATISQDPFKERSNPGMYFQQGLLPWMCACTQHFMCRMKQLKTVVHFLQLNLKHEWK